MRKLIGVLVLLLLLAGCKQIVTYDPPPRYGEYTLSPPAWIMGTWTEASGILKVVFSWTNQSITTTISGTVTATLDFAKDFDQAGFSEAKGTGYYELSTSQDSIIQFYRFDQISATSLAYTAGTRRSMAPGVPLVPVVFTKQ